MHPPQRRAYLPSRSRPMSIRSLSILATGSLVLIACTPRSPLPLPSPSPSTPQATSTPYPNFPSQPTPTPFTIPSGFDESQRETIHGKVYDDTGAVLSAATVVG